MGIFLTDSMGNPPTSDELSFVGQDLVDNSDEQAGAGTTTQNHNITDAPRSLILAVPSDWLPAASVSTGMATVTVMAANQFTYAGPTSTPVSTGTGKWNYPIQYCFNSVGSSWSTHAANVLSAVYSGKSFQCGGTDEANSVAIAMEGSYGWASVMNLEWGPWKFHMCGTTGTGNNPLAPKLHFSELPPYGNTPVQQRHEGQQYWIVDGPDRIGLEQNVTTGGGTNKYLVRYNGTNWTRVA